MTPGRSRARARLAPACLALGLASACGSPEPEPQPSPTPDPASRSGFSYRGLAHVSWWHDEYASAEASASRRALAATGSNWAAVLVTWYMESRDASLVVPVTPRTPTDAAVSQAIRELREAGLKVMLKPHVDVLDGSWRGTIRPADEAAWFASYAEFVVRYARLAQASGAEMFCVGSELASLSDARRAAPWAGVIAAVRSAYGGRLSYAANAVGAGDEFTSVAFWPQLDVAGLDAYTPLTDRTSPSLEELIRGWSRNRNGEDMVAAFRNWQAALRKPVLFTELGYRSADGANRAPYDFEASAPYDPGEQADCYEAAFRVFSRESWMRGILWWNWPVPEPGPQDTDYNPRGKPAEGVLRSWHAP